MICYITADVYAHWSETPPVYRIYVDDCMMTERTFGWPSYQNYLTEKMSCELIVGVHKLRIENCKNHGTFELKNFTIDNEKSVTLKSDDLTEITFTVDSGISSEMSNLNRIHLQQEAILREQQMLLRQQQTQ